MPGGAMLASEYGGKLILALSGSPGAAVLGLTRIAAPFLLRLTGRAGCAGV
jgi:molybdopterin molybdotransferase